MAPALVLDEGLDVRLAGNIAAGPDLGKAAIERDEVPERFACELEAFVRSLEILVRGAAGVDASVVVVEVDLRHVPGISRLERDGAGVVSAVRLEDDPGPVLGVCEGVGRVAGEVSLELGGGTRDQQVRLVFGDGRLDGDGDRNSVGPVDALGDGVHARLVRFQALVRHRLQKGARGREDKIAVGLADDRAFVAVLHVAAHAGQIDNDGDIEGLELGFGAYAA